MQQDLAARYHQALGRLVAAWPGAFAGTDLDPDTTRKRMEKLRGARRGAGRADKAQGPGAAVAGRAARAAVARAAGGEHDAGGKTVETEESRWRAAEQEVRSAQAQWTRLGPLPADVAGPLNERFQRACRRFYDSRPRMVKA